MPDFVGNTVSQDGSRVNISREIGYPISRESLEKLSQQAKSWIPVPKHQQGGRLEKTDQNSIVSIAASQKQNNKSNSQTILARLSLFAAATVIGVTAVASLLRPKL